MEKCIIVQLTKAIHNIQHQSSFLSFLLFFFFKSGSSCWFLSVDFLSKDKLELRKKQLLLCFILQHKCSAEGQLLTGNMLEISQQTNSQSEVPSMCLPLFSLLFCRSVNNRYTDQRRGFGTELLLGHTCRVFSLSKTWDVVLVNKVHLLRTSHGLYDRVFVAQTVPHVLLHKQCARKYKN